MLTFFWTVYGVAAAIVVYRASSPLQWELLLLLGGIGALLVVQPCASLARARRRIGRRTGLTNVASGRAHAGAMLPI